MGRALFYLNLDFNLGEKLRGTQGGRSCEFQIFIVIVFRIQMGEISVAVRVVYNGGCDSSRDEFERLSAAIIDAFRSTEVTSDIPENIQNVRGKHI